MKQELAEAIPSTVSKRLDWDNRITRSRVYPPPKMGTAAPMGIGNGGKLGKRASKSKAGFYSTNDIGAIAKRYPIIARHIFGFEEREMSA